MGWGAAGTVVACSRRDRTDIRSGGLGSGSGRARLDAS